MLCNIHCNVLGWNHLRASELKILCEYIIYGSIRNIYMIAIIIQCEPKHVHIWLVGYIHFISGMNKLTGKFIATYRNILNSLMASRFYLQTNFIIHGLRTINAISCTAESVQLYWAVCSNIIIAHKLFVQFILRIWTPVCSALFRCGCIVRSLGNRAQNSPTLYELNFSVGTKTYIIFYVIYPHWHCTGCWDSPSSKTRTYLFYIVNIMVADVLAMEGARASATMTFTMLNRINPACYGLRLTLGQCCSGIMKHVYMG